MVIFLCYVLSFLNVYSISLHPESVVICSRIDKSHVESDEANDRSGHLTVLNFISP